jgi:hypothetical protein
MFLSGSLEACFVIRILESDATIKVPLTRMESNGIRQLLDGKKVKDLYKEGHETPVIPPGSGPPRWESARTRHVPQRSFLRRAFRFPV